MCPTIFVVVVPLPKMEHNFMMHFEASGITFVGNKLPPPRSTLMVSYLVFIVRGTRG